ncbi:DGQHR domain-containing protein [Gloeothece verrucosa]|uniref:DGQHR domain protein n=1 Tax=Gloeothece verrucosa (strain PCC 7822) TaxID=497965 RepID=E0U835_GLOV7|nr:DGQHR domain-containing protein [Gloeothece verrucosa]ADN17240.1 DGQHR domain protein [Gloeothece verrucosa PCC 7822]
MSKQLQKINLNSFAKPNQILVQKTQMGMTPAFIGSVSLEWLAARVDFAAQLPLFKHKIDATTNNIIRDDQTIEEIQQRPLDWSRQSILTQYLIEQNHHKFPPVLVVVSPAWVDDFNAPEWDEEGKAMATAMNFLSLDDQESFGRLDIPESVPIFALDGQHRLMGIKGLMELITTGQLIQYNKNKQPTGSVMTVKNLGKNHQLKREDLIRLSQEKIGIEFIPAVVAGETRETAKRRVRSIFVHVNLMATPLSKGQLVLLNEDNGFSLAARKVAVTHPLLKEQAERPPRVDWDKANITAKSTVLTTLQALQDMAEGYLKYYLNWQPSRAGLIPLRPSEEELEKGISQLSELFNYLATLPSYQKLEQGINTIQMRHFSHEKFAGEGNLLFRPVGQIALAQALGVLQFKKKFSLLEIFKKLGKFDLAGGFSRIEFPQSLWYGIIYDPRKQRILVSGRDLSVKLMIYLLGGIDDKMEKAYLREAVARARTVENRAIGFDGSFVKPREVGLPEVLKDEY